MNPSMRKALKILTLVGLSTPPEGKAREEFLKHRPELITGLFFTKKKKGGSEDVETKVEVPAVD